MFAQFYSGMRWSALPVFALVLFLTTFLVVVLRTMLLAKRTELDQLSRLPLDATEVATRRERPRS
jgi:hypothetical protein